MKDTVIKICMGSSCFSRGNNENLGVIQEFIKNNNLPVEVHLTGNLCQGMCHKGPNLFIDEKVYHRVDRDSTYKILEDYFKEK